MSKEVNKEFITLGYDYIMDYCDNLPIGWTCGYSYSFNKDDVIRTTEVFIDFKDYLFEAALDVDETQNKYYKDVLKNLFGENITFTDDYLRTGYVETIISINASNIIEFSEAEAKLVNNGLRSVLKIE